MGISCSVHYEKRSPLNVVTHLVHKKIVFKQLQTLFVVIYNNVMWENSPSDT